MDYKVEIQRAMLDRRKVAEALGLTYSQLSMRLSNFTPWQAHEEYELVKIINESNNLQKGKFMNDTEKAEIRKVMGAALHGCVGRDVIVENLILNGSVKIRKDARVVAVVDGDEIAPADFAKSFKKSHPDMVQHFTQADYNAMTPAQKKAFYDEGGSIDEPENRGSEFFERAGR